MGFLHNTFKLAVFAFIQEPVTVAYEAKGLWRLVAAIDIAFNSRWIGLRKLRYDGIKTEASVRVERQRQLVNRRTRVQSLSRHAAYASLYWIIFDIVVELIRALSWDTIGRSDPPPHALNRFVYHTAFVLLPNSRYATSAPEWFMMALIKLLTGVAVWFSLSAGYHTFALLFIGSGMHAPDSWDRDTFDKPLNSDSLFDFWRRWHQLFTVCLFLSKVLGTCRRQEARLAGIYRRARKSDKTATLFPRLDLHSHHPRPPRTQLARSPHHLFPLGQHARARPAVHDDSARPAQSCHLFLAIRCRYLSRDAVQKDYRQASWRDAGQGVALVVYVLEQHGRVGCRVSVRVGREQGVSCVYRCVGEAGGGVGEAVGTGPGGWRVSVGAHWQL